MTGILTSQVNLPACCALEAQYGPQLQRLDTSTRLHLVATLACAAAAVEQDGLSEFLDVALLDVFPDAPDQLLQLLRELDGQLPGWCEAAALAGAIASNLASFATV